MSEAWVACEKAISNIFIFIMQFQEEEEGERSIRHRAITLMGL